MFPVLLPMILACGASTSITVSLAVEDGVAPPTGVASLSPRETTGDVDEDGTVLVPAVSSEDYGEIRFGEEMDVTVPQGWIALDVVGFDDSGACGAMENQQGTCAFAGWEGNASFWVGEDPPPRQYSRPELSVAPGEEASLEILVLEGCMCDD